MVYMFERFASGVSWFRKLRLRILDEEEDWVVRRSGGEVRGRGGGEEKQNKHRSIVPTKMSQRGKNKKLVVTWKEPSNASLGITWQLQPTESVKKWGAASPRHWARGVGSGRPTNPQRAPSLTQASVCLGGASEVSGLHTNPRWHSDPVFARYWPKANAPRYISATLRSATHQRLFQPQFTLFIILFLQFCFPFSVNNISVQVFPQKTSTFLVENYSDR